MSHRYRLRLVIVLLIALTSSCSIKNDASNRTRSRSTGSIDVPSYSTKIAPGETRMPVETPTLTLEPVLEVPMMIYQLSSPVFAHKSADTIKVFLQRG